MTDTPELEAALYKLADNAAGLASTGYYNHKEIKGDIAAILQALAAEIERVLNNARSKEPFVCEYGHKVYGHTTADSWCCACEADQAFMKAEIERAEVAALKKLNTSSKLMQSPYKPGTVKSGIYQQGAQDAHKVWHEQIDEILQSKTGGDNAKG